MITQDGKIIRTMVDGIRVIGRSTMGVKLMELDENDQLVAMAKIADRDPDEEADAAEDSEAQATVEEVEEPVN